MKTSNNRAKPTALESQSIMKQFMQHFSFSQKSIPAVCPKSIPAVCPKSIPAVCPKSIPAVCPKSIPVVSSNPTPTVRIRAPVKTPIKRYSDTKYVKKTEKENDEKDEILDPIEQFTISPKRIIELSTLLTEFTTSKSYVPVIRSEPLYHNLVLSGGSLKGVSHIGALARLSQEGLIDLRRIKAIAATSAGAMLGLLLVLGLDLQEIWNIIVNLDVTKIMNPDFGMLLTKCGVEIGQNLLDFFENLLTIKTGIQHINFRQLYKKTGIDFTIVGSCLTSRKPVYFNRQNTPTLKVSIAVRISLSIPFLFVPVTVDDNKYIDGGILDNYPMTHFANELDKTIGIMICNEYSTIYQNIEEYVVAIINLFMHHFYESQRDKWSADTIYVYKTATKVNILDFNVDDATKIELIKIGMEAAHEFVTKNVVSPITPSV